MDKVYDFIETGRGFALLLGTTMSITGGLTGFGVYKAITLTDPANMAPRVPYGQLTGEVQVKSLLEDDAVKKLNAFDIDEAVHEIIKEADKRGDQIPMVVINGRDINYIAEDNQCNDDNASVSLGCNNVSVSQLMVYFAQKLLDARMKKGLPPVKAIHFVTGQGLFLQEGAQISAMQVRANERFRQEGLVEDCAKVFFSNVMPRIEQTQSVTRSAALRSPKALCEDPKGEPLHSHTHDKS
jgi:hypothetical protein